MILRDEEAKTMNADYLACTNRVGSTETARRLLREEIPAPAHLALRVQAAVPDRQRHQQHDQLQRRMPSPEKFKDCYSTCHLLFNEKTKARFELLAKLAEEGNMEAYDKV